jgi:3-hydroxybutyryl-CoA dehydratase
METVSEFTVNEVYEGQSFSFDVTLSEAMTDSFAHLTGDVSPLHMDQDFATNRGFQGRVVHGALLCGLVSRLIGVHLPGRDCLLHSMNMKYLMPTYINDLIRTKGTIDQVSVAARAMSLQVEIINVKSHLIVAKGKVVIGFTNSC